MSKNHNLTLAGPDLAALLCSRVCHDIISPVGAINNGLELLDEGGADADAMDLIRTSALNASVRLKFARLAFGASGSVGASIDTGEAEKAVIDYVSADKKTEVTWSGPRAIIPKNQVKLLLNLFLVAYGAIPRGGQIDVVIETPETEPRFRLGRGDDHVRCAARAAHSRGPRRFRCSSGRRTASQASCAACR
jgi:histidine phosphotransferase ChpT